VKRHVVLIGLSGSGKTTIGRIAAHALDAQFIGIDGRIEAALGMTISEIFERRGEGTFRDAERSAVAAALSEPPAVVDPGAGWAAEPGNLAGVRENVFIIYLETPPAEAARRLRGTSDRPLLTGDPLAALERLLEAREGYYLAADAVVETAARSAEQVAEEVVTLARRSAGW
jgi:shikimate kinase